MLLTVLKHQSISLPPKQWFVTVNFLKTSGCYTAFLPDISWLRKYPCQLTVPFLHHHFTLSGIQFASADKLQQSLDMIAFDSIPNHVDW